MPASDDALDSEIQRFLGSAEPPGGFVTKWFLVAEGLGPEGGRYMEYVWSDGIKTWDVRGMLYEALASQLSGQVADELREA